MLTRLLLFCFAISASFVVAQQGNQTGVPLLVCAPQGCISAPVADNIIIGVGLRNKDGSRTQLLPGHFTADRLATLNLDQLLPPFTTLISSTGYKLSSNVSPVDVLPIPGFITYAGRFYKGPAKFYPLPESFSKKQISMPSDALSAISVYPGAWVAIALGSQNPTIFYDTAPIIPLPPTGQSLKLLDYQLSTCQPPCTGSGRCITSGKCACDKGFSGPLCEVCALGFFGTACKPCPSPCNHGCNHTTALCLSTPKASKAKREQKTCKCLNGQCHDDGNCSCLPGWTNATELDGVTCTQCAEGFYSTSDGDCRICERGCSKCKDITGICTSCQKGYKLSQSADDTKCDEVPTTTQHLTCPEGSFSNGEACDVCSPSCGKCNGPLKTDCMTCPSGAALYNKMCYTVNSDGVCEGTNGMIVNNNKQMCDTCGSKCTACKIPNFGPASTMQDVECSECLAGAAPTNGTCASLSCQKGQYVSGSTCKACSKACGTCTGFPENCTSCPKGHYLSGSSGSPCLACSSKCSSCDGHPDKCLTCKLRLSSGGCVSTCPKGTIEVDGHCINCHGDCDTCTGLSYNECSSCREDRPVLSNGRCFRTCSKKSEYFDYSSNSCQTCDASCSSCTDAGPSNCLACSNSTDVLQDGGCSPRKSGELVLLGMDFGPGVV